MQRKGSPFALLVEMHTGRATLNSVGVLQKVKNRTTLWPSNCTTRYLPKGYKNTKDTKSGRCTPMFIAALSTITKLWREPKCPSTDEWIKKMWNTYTMVYYSAIKKSVNFVICNDVDGARMYYAKWNQSIRERQTPYDFTHMWNLRNKTDEHMGRGTKRGEKETNHKSPLMIENKLRVDGGKRVGDGLVG